VLLLLSGAHRQQLQHLLEQAPLDGGLWAGPKIAHWMGEQLEGQSILNAAGSISSEWASPPSSRPCHHKADPVQREAFKRELPERIRQVQLTHPAAQVKR
jgi:hypothetical protein